MNTLKPIKGRSFLNLSLRNRLLLFSLVVLLIPLVGVSLLVLNQMQSALREQMANNLVAVRQLTARQVEDYIQSVNRDIALAVQLPTVVEAAREFAAEKNLFAIRRLGYLGKPDLIHSGNSDSYDIIHARYFDFFQRIVVTKGYYDIYLIAPNGDVIYNYDKGDDFATNLLSGPYSETILADLFRELQASTNRSAVKITDFAIYGPSGGAPASFAGVPIVKDGRNIGVLIYQLPVDQINALLQDRTGLGETGESYLVGADKLMRSDSRFQRDSTILKQSVDTLAVQKALANHSGVIEITGYRDVITFSAYQPIKIGDLNWALIVEVDRAEFFAPASNVRNLVLSIIGLVTLTISGLSFILANQIAGPIKALTVSAQQIGAGKLDAEVREVERRDEIGVLARTFRQMQGELSALYTGLEQQVADRTHALATSANVSRRLSTILNRRELVIEVVEQVKEAFGYYHAHIYLYNNEGDELVMAGGTGDVGAAMLAEGHKIPKGRGLVGRAAESNEPVLVSDTEQDPDWLPNPLLPDTRAEVAIPISLGDQVLGVLDVQHDIAGGVGPEDVDALVTIANQVAVAMQNISQYEKTRKVAADLGVVANVGIATSTISEAERLLQEVVDLSKQSFNLYHVHIYLLNEAGDVLELASGAGEVGRKMVAEGRQIPLISERSLVARAARMLEGVIVNDVQSDPDFLPNPFLPKTRAEMAVPMLVSGKVIGVLDVQAEQVNRFTETDINIHTTLASQIAVALQNARSFAKAQKQAERETKLNLITQNIQKTATIEEAMQIAARELGHALGRRKTLVTLDPSVVRVEQKGTVEK